MSRSAGATSNNGKNSVTKRKVLALACSLSLPSLLTAYSWPNIIASTRWFSVLTKPSQNFLMEEGEERGDVDVTMPDLDADGEADQGSGASEMSDVQDDDTN